MKTVTLILTIEATTVSDIRSDSSSDTVAPAVATVSLMLFLLLLLTVVASRVRIRVTVFIGDCQAHVSSSSEGCSTSQKTVKVETY